MIKARSFMSSPTQNISDFTAHLTCGEMSRDPSAVGWSAGRYAWSSKGPARGWAPVERGGLGEGSAGSEGGEG